VFVGYNLHLDQSEKLVDYGCVLIGAIDGHSGFLTAFAIMPRKNAVAGYRDTYCQSVNNFGLWDQVHRPTNQP
jgi:hypothetical protein